MNRRGYVIGSFVFCLLSLTIVVHMQGPVEAAMLLQPGTHSATPPPPVAPSPIPPTNTPIPPTATPLQPAATSAPPAATAVAVTATAPPASTPPGKPADTGPSPIPTASPATDTKGATPVPTLTSITPATTGPTSTAFPTPTFVPSSADLAVAVHVSANSVRVGQIITFFINVTNQGSASAPATRVVMTVPGGATPVYTGPACGLGSITGLLDCTSSGAACTPVSFGGSVNCSVPVTVHAA